MKRDAMPALLSFKGRLGRMPYAVWSLATFASQHLVVFIAFRLQGRSLPAGWQESWTFYALPARWPVTLDGPPNLLTIAVLSYMRPALWALAAVAFRRASDADKSEWIAAFAIAPIVQILAIMALSVLPAGAGQQSPPEPAG